MKNRRVLVRIFCALLACVFLPFAALSESATEPLTVENSLLPTATLPSVEVQTTPEPTATVEASIAPEPTATVDASITPEPTATVDASITPEATAIVEASVSPEATAIVEASVVPDASASASPVPTASEEASPAPGEVLAGEAEIAPEPTAALPQGSGNSSFCLTAYGQDRLLIAPMTVNCSVSDTLSTALEKLNGHSIFDLESGDIERIDGVSGVYCAYDENGEADLNGYAADVRLIVLSESGALSAALCSLIRLMAAYSDSAEARENEAATAVYQEILAVYPSISDADAAQWTEKLSSAMKGEEISTGDPNAPEQIDGVYQIRTGGELKWFAEHTQENPSASAALLADVSLSGMAWTPIGSKNAPYTGTFNGNGHKISHLTISATGDYQALFGYAGKGASIGNLTVSGSVDAGGNYAAGIVAYSEVSLSGLHNRCKVTSSGQYVGGIIGAFANKNCKASECSNSAAIYASNASGASYAGGILGGKLGIVENCKNSGSVTAYAYVGGVAGQASDVKNCENTGDIQCTSQYGGGIVGRTSTATGCKNSGTLTGSGVYVDVKARYEADYIGGVAGFSATIADCENRGRILTRDSLRTHFSSVGGVVGKANGASDCVNYGAVSVSGSYIAGVVGGNGGGSVVRCVNFGDVYNASSTGEQTGGVASAGKLEQCYNLGAVSGYDSVGGVAGGTTNTTLKYCYNLGAVSGHDYVGGAVGNCLSLSYCYSAAEVKTSGSIGGLLAGDYASVQEAYYLNEYSLYSKAGVGLARKELRLALRNAPHFVLNLDEDYHNGYPHLEFEKHDASVTAEAVLLNEGEKSEYYVLCGGTVSGLPKSVCVRAGGLALDCAVEWIAPEDFDNSRAGSYAFSPKPVLPKNCRMDEGTQAENVTVVVCPEEALPLITAVSLEDGVQTQLVTAYGKAPENLPEYALATIDGELRRLAIEWTAPDNLDLTDTEAEFVYTLRFCEACRIAENVSLPIITLRVRPMMLLSDMRFTETVNAESRSFSLTYQGAEMREGVQTFRYTLDILDSTTSVYICALADEAYGEDVHLSYSYKMLNAGGYENSDDLKAGKITNLFGFAAASKKYVAENRMVLRACANTDAGEIVQDYVIETVVRPTLGSAKLMMGKTAAYLAPVFEGDWLDYRAQIVSGVEEVEFRLTTTLASDALGGVTVLVNDQPLSAGEDGVYSASVAIAGDETPVSVRLRAGDEAVETLYQFHLLRLKETTLSVRCTPENARIRISNAQTGPVYADAAGNYSLIQSFEYTYSASAYNYLSQNGSFVAEDAQMTLELALEPAQKNENLIEDIESEWSGFRGDESNNAVSGSSTPISASDAVLYWANQAGIDYSSDAVSSPILVDGYLVCTAKQNIFKIDVVTGQIVQVGDMIKKSAFNITPPTYAQGMIFVALADGVVQAFNAKTLESLWVYTDPLGGQPNSPITYRDGYIYTGFWNGETDNGNWVCLSVTDENLSKTNEAKQAAWVYAQKGGFYWAGAYVSERFMLVGTDDGVTGYTSASSNLLSLDPDTGRLIDCLSGLEADIRCTICYDSATNRYYFTSKGGYFYSVAVSQDGYFQRDSLKQLCLRGDRNVEGMSTSTPVVYNGRAYVGVSGLAQFQPYSGHGIAVIDLAAWEIAYICPTKGYPQSSGLLTNAYESTGLVYIYFFDNMTPGCLRVIRDCPGQTQLLSIYDASPIEEAEILFTPRGSQRQYALCSPIVDQYGTIYFKNDSGYMMALGSRVLRLEVTQQPDKLLYEEGEKFDPEGMKVVQHLANGAIRDVSENVSWPDVPLTAQDTDVTIYFDYICYNDDAEVLDKPQTSVNLTVLSTQDMTAVRSVMNAIADLGEVDIDSGDAIAQIRADYDALSEALQELIVNYEGLTRAEEAWALLEKAERQNAETAERLILAIGEVTLESGAAIQKAFEVYNALSDYGKGLVESTALLMEKQQQYATLAAQSDAEAGAIMAEISALGEITLESGRTLYALRDRYERLPEASKALVSNLSLLEAAEKRYNELIEQSGEKARQVVEMIEAIGEVTLEKEVAILRAREAYDALDEAIQAEISNYEKLLAAENALQQLKDQLGGMSEITARLDALVAQIQQLAPEEAQVTAQNAAAIAPLLNEISTLISAQSLEDQPLLLQYSRFADAYRIAVGNCVHSDAATGVSVDGLEWYQQLRVENLTSSADADYSRFKTLISPRRVIKLYRVTVLDLIHGTQDVNHGALNLRWTIPVPRYNESSYSSIGVVYVGETAAAQYMESSYANHNRSLKFATRGDGLIGVGGVKAQMNASGSVSGSGSVLGGVESSGSVFDQQPSSGGNAPQISYRPSDGSSGSLTSYSDAQSVVLSQYGSAIESGEWYYREVVVLPTLLAQFSNSQVSLYEAMSQAVESGTNRFFGYTVSPQEFQQVYDAYRLSNPLSALAEMSYVMEDGMVEADYALSEDTHIDAVESWHIQVERIVNYCLIQGDVEITAARLYQQLAQTLTLAPAEHLPAEDDPMAGFWPSPYYALMNERADENDSAKLYAYLLMQVGLDCMLVTEAPEEDIEETIEEDIEEIIVEAIEETSTEERLPEKEIHLWTVLWQGAFYTHADLEMDLYREDAPEAERNALGHFGMNDESRAETLDGRSAYRLYLPESMTPADNSDDADANQRFAVPECATALSDYVASESEPVEEVTREE